jgi:hypothetical protein
MAKELESDLASLQEQFHRSVDDKNALRHLHKLLKRSVAKMCRCPGYAEYVKEFKILKLQVKTRLAKLTKNRDKPVLRLAKESDVSVGSPHAEVKDVYQGAESAAKKLAVN